MIIKNGVEIRLKDELDSRGMKQEFLCRVTGISNTSMSALCKGESLPNLKNSLKIAKALNKNVEDLWVLLEDE